MLKLRLLLLIPINEAIAGSFIPSYKSISISKVFISSFIMTPLLESNIH